VTRSITHHASADLVKRQRTLSPCGPAGLPCLLYRCIVTPPTGLGGSDGRCVSGCSSDRSIIPGQGLFVVTPSGGEHSRSRTRTQGAQEEATQPRATIDPGKTHDRPPRRTTTPTAYQLSSPPA